MAERPSRPAGPAGARLEGGNRLVRETLRAAVLRVLAEGPGHGYQILRRIEEATQGYWRPTPGTLYPLLDQLEREGVIEKVRVETQGVKSGKRIMYKLTPRGWRELAEIVLLKARIRPYYTIFQVVEAIRYLRRAGLEDQAFEACETLRRGLRDLLRAVEDTCGR